MCLYIYERVGKVKREKVRETKNKEEKKMKNKRLMLCNKRGDEEKSKIFKGKLKKREREKSFWVDA